MRGGSKLMGLLRRRPFILTIVTFAFLWAILETISWVVYKSLPNFNGKRIVESNLAIPVSSPNKAHPYLLYVNNPAYFDGVRQHNSLGYRNDEFRITKETGTVRILALGGSTTYGHLQKDRTKVWPAILERKLCERFPNKRIEVINAGLNYATSAELLAGYVFRHRYLRPDLVIFHEGGNDVLPVLFPKYDAEYTHVRAPGISLKLRRGESFLIHSNVLKLFYAGWLNNQEVVASVQPASFGTLTPSEVALRITDDSNYEGFRRNVELLIKLGKLDGSQVVLFGFLSAREANIAKERPDLRGLEACIWTATERNKQIMQELALAAGCLYINPEQSSFMDEWFKDNCHLTEEGENAKADLLTVRLAENCPILKQD